MKQYNGCKAFESMEEFTDEFALWASKDNKVLSDNLYIEGNSNLKFADILDWVRFFGVGNVYFDMSYNFIDTFYIDLKHAEFNGDFDILNTPDELSIDKDGMMCLLYY